MATIQDIHGHCPFEDWSKVSIGSLYIEYGSHFLFKLEIYPNVLMFGFCYNFIIAITMILVLVGIQDGWQYNQRYPPKVLSTQLDFDFSNVCFNLTWCRFNLTLCQIIYFTLHSQSFQLKTIHKPMRYLSNSQTMVFFIENTPMKLDVFSMDPGFDQQDHFYRCIELIMLPFQTNCRISNRFHYSGHGWMIHRRGLFTNICKSTKKWYCRNLCVEFSN